MYNIKEKFVKIYKSVLKQYFYPSMYTESCEDPRFTSHRPWGDPLAPFAEMHDEV